MTQTWNPYAKSEQFAQSCKEQSRATILLNQVDASVRDAEKALKAFKVAADEYHDTMHKMRCGYPFHDLIPDAEIAKTWMANEIARVLGPSNELLSFIALNVDALATDKLPSLLSKTSGMAEKIRTAMRKRHEAERAELDRAEELYAAEQRKLRELQS